jgi:GrpB-like predicted nucleotidyltransferase (UPF0157 family)
MSEILIQEHNESWPLAFQTERDNLVLAVPMKIKGIHHIGSTSVPGLAAKPIIDIMLEVADVEALDKLRHCFEALGYECMGEFGIAGRRFFRKGRPNRRTHHIHAFEVDSIGARRHLAFRDYMRAHPQIAAEYEALKRAIAAGCDGDIERYCDGKAEFVREHERLALDWWTQVQRPTK